MLKLLHKIERGITLPNFLWRQYYLDTKTRKQDKTTKEENYRLVSLVNTKNIKILNKIFTIQKSIKKIIYHIKLWQADRQEGTLVYTVGGNGG